MAAASELQFAAPAFTRAATPYRAVAVSATLPRTAATRSVALAAVALQRLRTVQLSLSTRQQLLQHQPVWCRDVATRRQRRLPGRLPGRSGRQAGRLGLQPSGSVRIRGRELWVRRLLRRPERVPALLP